MRLRREDDKLKLSGVVIHDNEMDTDTGKSRPAPNAGTILLKTILKSGLGVEDFVGAILELEDLGAVVYIPASYVAKKDNTITVLFYFHIGNTNRLASLKYTDTNGSATTSVGVSTSFVTFG